MVPVVAVVEREQVAVAVGVLPGLREQLQVRLRVARDRLDAELSELLQHVVVVATGRVGREVRRGLPSARLGLAPGEHRRLNDQWGFVVASDDPADELTMSDLNYRPWVVAQVGNREYGRGMQQVLAAGVRPRADVIVSGSMSMPFFLRGTDRIAVMGRRLVDEMGELYGIRAVPGPMELETMRTAFWWHPSRRDDPVHRWFRTLLTQAPPPSLAP